MLNNKDFFSQILSKQYKSSLTPFEYTQGVETVMINVTDICYGMAIPFFGYKATPEVQSRIANLLGNDDIETLLDKFSKSVVGFVQMISNRFDPRTTALYLNGICPLACIPYERTLKLFNFNNKYFNTNSIYPYTAQMEILGTCIQNIALTNLKSNVIRFSNYDVPEEATQKLFTNIRLKNVDDHKTIYIHGINGPNLAMSLFSDAKSIFLFEDIPNELIVDDPTIDTSIAGTSTQIINISDFKTRLVEWNDTYSVYNDFVFMLLLLGSHYYPPAPGLTFYNVHALMSDVYSGMEDSFLKGDGEINTLVLAEFLENLDADYLLSNHIKMSKTIGSDSYLANLEIENYRNNWYGYIGADANVVTDMCVNWIEMLNWTYRYYRFGYKAVSNTIYYRYPIAPLVSDIILTLRAITKITIPLTRIALNPYAIILDTFPQSSSRLVNDKIRYLFANLNKAKPVVDTYLPKYWRVVVMPHINYQARLALITSKYKVASEASAITLGVLVIKVGAEIEVTTTEGQTISKLSMRLLNRKAKVPDLTEIKELPLEDKNIRIRYGNKEKVRYIKSGLDL